MYLDEFVRILISTMSADLTVDMMTIGGISRSPRIVTVSTRMDLSYLFSYLTFVSYLFKL